MTNTNEKWLTEVARLKGGKVISVKPEMLEYFNKYKDVTLEASKYYEAVRMVESLKAEGFEPFNNMVFIPDILEKKPEVRLVVFRA